MKTLSKRLIQAGLPTLAIAAVPALADNFQENCPQPVPTVPAYSNLTNLAGSLGFGAGNGTIVEDVDFPAGMAGEELTSISMVGNYTVAVDVEFVIFADDGTGDLAGGFGGPLGPAIARIDMGNHAGTPTLTADLTGMGITIPADGKLWIGQEWGPAGGFVGWINSTTPPDIGVTNNLLAFCGGNDCTPASFLTASQFGHTAYALAVEVVQPLASRPCSSDTDANGFVDVVDLLAVLGGWGDLNPDVAPPPSGDDTVDVLDLLAVLGDWGDCEVITNDDVENAYHLCIGTGITVIPYSTSDTGNGDPATTDGPGDIGPECDGGSPPTNDIWYRMTADFTGLYIFSTCSAATQAGVNDTVIAIYSTESFPPTREQLIICNDDDPSCAPLAGVVGGPSTVELAIFEGEEVYIQIGGFGGAIGEGELVVNLDPSNANENCDNAAATPFNELIVVDYLQGAGAFIDEGDETCGTPFVAPNLWWRFIGSNTTITVDPCFAGSDFGAGDGTDIYMDVHIAAFCGNSCNPAARTCLGGSNSTSPGECSEVLAGEFSFCTADFSNVWIRVQATPFHEDFEDEPTRFVAFEVTSDGVQGLCTEPDCGLTPPANDHFENAITVECGTLEFRTLAAGTDGIAHPACDTGGDGGVTVSDVWYKFSLADETALTVSTCNAADYDSDLVLYTDPGGTTPPDAGDFVACNDDGAGCAGFSSHLQAIVPAGDYVIRLGGWLNEDPGDGSGDSGTGVLTILCEEPPPSPADEPEDAPLIVGDFSHFFGVTTANTENGPNGLSLAICSATGGGHDWFPFGNNSPENDAWYLWEATSTGNVTISLCTSNTTGGADTRIAIWPGDVNPPTDVNTVVACDDDGCGGSALSSEVTFAVTAGDQYLIEMGTWSTAQSGTINVVITE